MAFRGIDVDPIRNFKFQVEFPSAILSGNARSGFSRVSGLKEQTEAVDYREGTDPARPRKLFGQTSFDNVILERGMSADLEFIIWRRKITNVGSKGQNLGAEGDATVGDDLLRRDVTIQLGDYHAEGGSTGAWEWTLLEAWPLSLEVGEFSGDGNDVVLETVELVHEGMNILGP